MEEIVRDYIKGLYAKDTIIKSIDKDIQNLREHRKECLEYLKVCLSNPELKSFIDQKLVEGNEKFELDKNKGKIDEQYEINKWSCCSSNGEIEEHEHRSINPRGKFIPSNDEYEIVKVEKNDSGEYKITVDNCKGRQHILAGCYYEPDYYYTDWFSI